MVIHFNNMREASKDLKSHGFICAHTNTYWWKNGFRAYVSHLPNSEVVRVYYKQVK